MKEQAAVICQQTSTNKTSRTEHSQKYGRVATRTKGREKRRDIFLKNTIRTNKTFYKLIAFTHGTRIRFLVSDALHQVRGGAVWQFVSARKVRAPVYAVQYYTKTCGRGLAAACTGSSRVNAHSTLENAARQDSNKPRCGTLDSRVVIVVTLYQVHCIFVC